jgi:hypothetical protein
VNKKPTPHDEISLHDYTDISRLFAIGSSQNDNSTTRNVSNLFYNMDNIMKSPLFFIGGYARSGTTLMRAVLDVHESVSCGNKNSLI